MTKNTLSTAPISNAEIHWNDAGEPHSTNYNDIYFSSVDALGESEYVFLEGNNLQQRWSTFSADTFVIAECGFGSGLNFMNTCKLWIQSSLKKTCLHYIACELHPLLKSDLKRLHQQWPSLSKYSAALLRHYPDHTAGMHRLHIEVNASTIILDLLYGDAKTSLNRLRQTDMKKVDAWYLDGFSPKLNPDMWHTELFQSIAALSSSDCSLSTYSAAGEVKRGLAAVGFCVKRLPGFGKKRHMVTATMAEAVITSDVEPTSSSHSHHQKTWFNIPTLRHSKTKKVIIIGAGLAGCATAFALARKGWTVTVIERHGHIATQASGNPQGIVYCKLHRQPNPKGEFIQQAYLYAIRQYQALAQHHDIDWNQCGMIQLAYHAKEVTRQQDIITNLSPNPRLCHPLSICEVNNKAQLTVNLKGLNFPESGWLNPKLLCQAYCQHPKINIMTNTHALQLHHQEHLWQILAESSNNYKKLNLEADAIIIANSIDAKCFSQSQHYPLIPNTGQVDFYPQSQLSQTLDTVLCSNAYIIPAHHGKHSVGGSFVANQLYSENTQQHRKNNFKLLNTVLPKLAQSLNHQAQISPFIKSRTGTRCSTPDYMPLIGPVEQVNGCKAIYGNLAKNAKKEISDLPEFHSGLYINTGYGSHGLTTTALGAEYLASLLSNKPLPLQNEIIECLHPIRYLIRDLKKQIL